MSGKHPGTWPDGKVFVCVDDFGSAFVVPPEEIKEFPEAVPVLPVSTLEGVAEELKRRADRKVDARELRRDDTSHAGSGTRHHIDGEAYGLRDAADLLRDLLSESQGNA